MCIQKKVSKETSSASLRVAPQAPAAPPPRADNPTVNKERRPDAALPTQPTQRSQRTVEEVKKRPSGGQKRKKRSRSKERDDDDTLKDVPMDMPNYDAEKDDKFDWKRLDEIREAQNKKASTETA